MYLGVQEGDLGRSAQEMYAMASRSRYRTLLRLYMTLTALFFAAVWLFGISVIRSKDLRGSRANLQKLYES